MAQLNRFVKQALILAIWGFSFQAQAKPFSLPLMRAETSNWTETGRAEESERLCLALAKAYPKTVRCESFGISPEGRQLRVLVVSGSGALTPRQAEKKSLPVSWIQAGIHAGEIEGKDAVYAFLKDELAKKKSVLDQQVILFCPIINIDGHERFGKWNRANQNGPVEKGWRVNSQNLNLNRDYAKLDTPEVVQSLKFIDQWNPQVWVDLHTTDGAKFQHDIAVMIPTVLTASGKLFDLSNTLQERMMSSLTRQGHLPLWFYPEFLKTDDPMSGIENLPDGPKMGYTYFGYRGRVGILVETHSWRTYEERALSTRHVIENLATDIASRGADYRSAAAEQDQKKHAGQAQVLGYQVKGNPETYDFLGYEYRVEKSSVTQQNWIQYNDQKPSVWKIPLWKIVEPSKSETVPARGYWIHRDVVPLVRSKIEAHGIHFEVLKKALTTELDVFRASAVEYDPGPVEGHQRAEWKGAWKKESVTIPVGSLFIPSEQPRMGIAMYLLEPVSADSFASWGLFNAYTEQKEYVEDYVLEVFAREELKKDNVKKAFEARLKADPDFSKSPDKRLKFFYELHPAFDEKYRKLPIYRG